MSELLRRDPYGPRDPDALLDELNALTAFHRDGCLEFARMWPDPAPATTFDALPWVHVAVFKDLDLRTRGAEIEPERQLLSSATTSGRPSRIALDKKSSKLQSESSRRILEQFVGAEARPLLVLDGVRSLRSRGEVSARVAAALSLQPFASELVFLMPDGPTGELDWQKVGEAARQQDALLVYGFTWVLWQAWATGSPPADVAEALATTQVQFVHSGGWKKLQAIAVEPAELSARLLAGVGPGSGVVDFYGLVEQVGVVYPLCMAGARHVPAWAEVLTRDPLTLESLPPGREGQLQLLNPLAHGAPYHSVLTEDVGRILDGACPCGREGRRFELIGRLPGAELRGCANV